MKRSMMLLAGLAFSLSTAFAQDASLAIGSKLPQETEALKATDGKTYTLGKQLTGKGLIVMFSCNTCPYVIKSQARTKEVMQLAKEKGLGMVIINSNTAQRDEADSYTAMEKYAKSQGYAVPYLLDEGKLVTAFGATRTPEVFLFNPKGELVYKGAMEDNPAKPSESKTMYLSEAVNNLISGKAIDPATTRSIGCSIKR